MALAPCLVSYVLALRISVTVTVTVIPRYLVRGEFADFSVVNEVGFLGFLAQLFDSTQRRVYSWVIHGVEAEYQLGHCRDT